MEDRERLMQSDWKVLKQRNEETQMKYFEVRDSRTMIIVAATRLKPASAREAAMLDRAGYGGLPYDPDDNGYVVVMQLDGGIDGRAQTDPFKWKIGRTMLYAHDYIRREFDELESGAVIDVEFMMGERDTVKESEIVEPSEVEVQVLGGWRNEVGDAES